MRWRGIIKVLSQDGERADFSKKTTAPRSLMTTYRMSLISARSISLDSTFKEEPWYQTIGQVKYTGCSVKLLSVTALQKLIYLTHVEAQFQYILFRRILLWRQ